MGLDIFFNKKKVTRLECFRKVNFLVKFFADKGFNVKYQIPYYIRKEDAEDLLKRCEQVLKDHDKCKELLPTMSGFFFGSTAYDDYYFSDVEEVRNFVKNKLLPKFDGLQDDEGLYFETWY